VGEIEQQWTALPGARRFKALREILHELAGQLGKLGGEFTCSVTAPSCRPDPPRARSEVEAKHLKEEGTT
jgi:hypothetical protein